jgi:predicted outer membrane repeat protein
MKISPTRPKAGSNWFILVVGLIVFAAALKIAGRRVITVQAQEAGGRITTRAAGRGRSFFNLRDGRTLGVTYTGEARTVARLKYGFAQPRSLATADFDRNGTPDVVAGYCQGRAGILTKQRGNPDAFAPGQDSVFARIQQGYNPDSLLPNADVYDLPACPDFLFTGNFTDDGEKDVVFAAKGGGLYVMPGDGAGGLGEAKQIDLPGPVTALAAGEFRAFDGHTDLAVGVSGPGGESLLIFDQQNGFASPLVQYQLSRSSRSIEFGALDGDPFMDVAIAAGSEVVVVHGWGRGEQVAADTRVERVDIGQELRGLAVGNFVWDRDGRSEIAVRTRNDTVQIIADKELDTRPFNQAEAARRTRGALLPQSATTLNVEAAFSWKRERATGWKETTRYYAAHLPGDVPRSLVRTHLANRELDEITLTGEAQLDVVIPLDPNAADPLPDQALSITNDAARVTLDVEDTPAAVLVLPRKLNGVTDVLMVGSMQARLTILPAGAAASITVDRTDDPSGAGLTAASACTAAANDCSLRGAVQFANANPGSTINLPAGTYALTIQGSNGCVIEPVATGNTLGDLEMNASTTIVGAGAATTIIRQTTTGDRVICLNAPLALGIQYTFSGITITGGRDASGLGGGGIIGGEKGNTLTLTNVTISNNQTTGNSVPGGGGGLVITGGDLTITNCLIGGTNAPGANRTDVTLGNQASTTSGGGLGFTPSAPNHTASTGTLTITGSTISNNDAKGNGGGGADLYILAFAAPGGIGSGTADIGASTFSNNSANSGLGGAGGAIFAESLGGTVATSSFTSNSATNRGGAIYVAGGTGITLNGTSPSVTFTGNTATNGGSTISTVSVVNVTGANVSLGGDVEVGQGGTWNNTAGSTVAPTNVVIAGGVLNMNNSTMNVSGNLTIGPGGTNGGTFNGNTGTVNIQGNFVLTAGGSGPATNLSAGTGTFNFNGSGAQSISNGTAVTFFNLTDSNTTQSLTANNSFVVNGSLNVNGANAIFNPVAGVVISGTGTLTGSGTARVTRTAATADFSSQYTITNKTLTNLTVEYIGAAAQVLSPITFGPLKINNGNGVTLSSGTATVGGLLTLTTGALGVANNTLVINAGSSVVGGSITSNSTGTVNYNQSSDGQNVRAFNYGNLTFSNFNKVLEPTGTISIAGVFTPGAATGHTLAGSTIAFNGAGAQIVPAFNYNNLTISGARGASNVTFANGGTVGVAGTLNPAATFSGGSYVLTNNTVDFNGGDSQTIPAFNYFNLTSSNTGARTLASSGNIAIASVFTPGTNAYTVAGSTVVYNGASAQTLPSGFATYANLTSNNTAGVGGFAGLTVQSTMRVQAGTFTASGATANVVQIDSGATLEGTSATTINVTGNWANNGTFTANANTVNFNGSGAQVIGGSSATTFNALTIANAGSGVTLGQNASVNAVLTLTNDLTTGANILTMPNTGASAGAADVVGNVKRTGFVGGGSALSFGNPFNSIGFIAQGSVPTDILVNLVKSAPGGFPGAAVSRTYIITPTGGAGFSATVRLHYLDSELNGNVEATLGLFRNNVRIGRSGSVDTVNNWAELSGVTQFSTWALSSARNNTTTEITADTPDPSQLNESVTINFKVLSAVAGAPQVTGNVTMTVNDASGDTCTGSINPADGTGSCSIAFTTFGSKTLTATYNGDDNANTSTDTEPHVIEKPQVTVAVSTPSVSEDGATNLVYTFTRQGATTSALTVNFTVAGTASSSTDYALTGAAAFDGANGTLTIPGGSSTATLTLDPAADTTVEPDETVIVNVATAAVYDVGTPGSATGTIANDDTDVSVAVSPASVTEDGATNLVYTFTRAGVTTGALTANFTVGGTATFNTDYTQSGAATFAPPNGAVQFAAGSSTATVTIDPTADTTAELDETVILTVVAGAGYNVAGLNNSATGTTTNDDTDVSVAVSPASVAEDGATNLVYTFTRAGVTTGALTVNFTVGGTATFNTDYTQSGAATFAPPNGTVQFAAGSSTATVTIDPTADTTVEPDETVILTVAAGGGYNVAALDNSATGTIANDDTDVTVAVSPASVTEDGATNLVYTFTRAGVTTGALTANFTVGGTATFNTDYTQSGAATFAPPNGAVQFAAGSSTATVTIDPTADTPAELDETVILTVAAGTGYNVAGLNNSATGTITNDDTDVSVAVSPASVAEDGTTNLVYTFTRAGVTTGALTVNFTVGGTATFNTDYTQSGAATFAPPNGTVQFAAGSSTATVTIDPTADTTVEPDETVILMVAAGTGYNVAAPISAAGTILSDDVSVPASIAANAGATPQSAFINTGFANALAVTVLDAANVAVPNANVTFTAPASGASGTFSNNTNTITVATNGSGIASAAITANGTTGGPYNVLAEVSPLAAINFSLTNLPSLVPPTVATSFVPATIAIGGTSSLTFTLGNPAGNTAALTGISLTDTLPVGVTASNLPPTSICGGAGTVSVTGSNLITLTGLTLAAGGTCQFSITVTGGSGGQHTNTTGAVSSTNGGTGSTASASLTVASPPTITKLFSAASILLNGSTTLTFTIANPAGNITLTGIGFDDSLPAGLVVATPNGLSSTCGGSVTAAAGSGSVSLSGGSLTAGSSCSVAVNVTGTSAGIKNNSTQVRSTEAGNGNTTNTSITVVAPPAIGKSFGAGTMNMGASTTLSFTVTNPNATTALNGVGFTDNLPSGLVVATPNGLTGSCGGGTITATAGARSVTLSGATIAASSNCTFSVNVTGTAPGAQTNVIDSVSSSNGGNGGSATASLTVLSPDLTIAKFHSGSFRQGQTGASYTITVTNSGTAPTTAAVTVTDSLPSSLTATAIVGSGWSCTLGTLSCTRSDALAASASYPDITLTVNVSGNAPSNVVNSASVSGGGEHSSSTGNNFATDPTVVIQVGDLTPPLLLQQTITFPPIPNHVFGDSPFAVFASASSGLPVALWIASGPATISGNVITLTGTGIVVVRAVQAGNGEYAPAEVIRAFTVLAPAPSTFSLTLAASPVAGGTVTASPAGPSYGAGSTATVTATANPGWLFTGFDGALAGLTNPQPVTMSQTRAVTANFVRISDDPADKLTLGVIQGVPLPSTQPQGDAYEPQNHIDKAPRAAAASVQVVPGTGGVWFTAVPSATAANGVEVALIPSAVAALKAGTYTGYVVATAAGGEPRALTVTLYVDTPAVARIVEGAGFRTQALASEQLVTVFGVNLARAAATAPGLPLGTTLANTTVTITDGAGVTRPAQLLFAGPTQINLLTPPGMASGAGSLTITNLSGQKTSSNVTIDRVSPGVFTAAQTGQGVAAAVIIRAAAGGSVTSTLAADCTGGACTANAIDVSAASDQVFLSLYGTGIRGVSGQQGVTVTVGGFAVDVQFAGAQTQFPGLDQVNVKLPTALAGSGDVSVVLTVDGRAANPVSVRIR